MSNNWIKSKFEKKEALIDLSSNITHLYTGQKFDPTKFKIDKKGWTHDHCDICYTMLEENDTLYQKEGEMICEKCYNKGAITEH